MPVVREEGIIEQLKRGLQHFPAGSVEINGKPSVGTVGVAATIPDAVRIQFVLLKMGMLML